MFFCCCFVLFCFLGAQGTGLGDLAVEVDGDDVGAQAQQREDGAHGLHHIYYIHSMVRTSRPSHAAS